MSNFILKLSSKTTKDNSLPIKPNRKVIMSIETMLKLNLKTNDYCLIKKEEELIEKRVIARVWPSFELKEKDLIVTDDTIRNLNGFHGDEVRVMRIEEIQKEIIDIKKVSLVPIAKEVNDIKDFKQYIEQLLGILEYVIIGEIITINLSGKPYLFKIESINENATPNLIGKYNLNQSILDITSKKAASTKSHVELKIGGIKKEIESIRKLIQFTFEKEDLLLKYNLKPSKGILLFGPPGTGKTLLAKSMAEYFNVFTLLISAPDLSSRYVGETEERIKELFQKAKLNQPCIICIDEIDAICPNRESSQSELEKRTVATFLTLMDGIGNETSSKVMVIGTTNRLHSIDPALRRPGRFDVEIEIGIPNSEDRFDILNTLLKDTYHELTQQQISDISDKAYGYVGADLSSLVKEAGLMAIKRNIEKQESDINELKLEYSDLITAFNLIKPSAMREVAIEVPKVYWSDIGGQHDIRQKLKESVEWPLKQPEIFTKFGISPPKGLLFYGPPGCSKTLMAKALATESGLNFLLVKGPELFDKYVGQSEKNLKEVFRKARQTQPSIIFFDELDALTVKREANNQTASVQERVLAQFLIELDGIDQLNHVTVIGATNRPDVIDPALLRPGRMDRILYVGPPDNTTRKEIFNIQSRKIPFYEDVDIDYLVKQTEGCSGAEIVHLCQEAAMNCIMKSMENKFVKLSDFKEILNNGLKRNITSEMLQFYHQFKIGSQLTEV
ncbi:AAA-domain-containing protein [Neoconidiobolus thromboides FSU 785]|nr:AAA-domain-containing protein [Neoconidiobolus thromboides FSU 785]